MSKEALGKGRAAIFEGLSPASSHQLPEASSQTQVASNHLQETSDHTPATSYQPPIDESILVQALAEAKESPKITIFSPKVAAVLRYKQVTGLPVMVQPNAGQPRLVNMKVTYDQTPEQISRSVGSCGKGTCKEVMWPGSVAMLLN